MRFSLACSLVVSLGAITLTSSPAQASSCGPFLEQLVPLDAELLPVSAMPHAIDGCGPDLHRWEVDVDGEPGELEVVEAVVGGYGIFALSISPVPEESSMVEIRGCASGCWEDEPEFDVLRSYMVTGPDATAPAPAELLAMDHTDEVIETTDFDTGETRTEAVRRWTLDFEAPDLSEPVIWEVLVGPSEGGSSEAATTAVARIMEDGVTQWVVTRTVADAGEEVCATVRAHDLSGNVSEDRQLCMSVDEDDTLPPIPGEGGSESGGDESGGSDETGGNETGDGSGGSDGSGDEGATGGLDVDDTGCSCTAGGGSPVGLGGLLGLVVLGLRRRRGR